MTCGVVLIPFIVHQYQLNSDKILTKYLFSPKSWVHSTTRVEEEDRLKEVTWLRETVGVIEPSCCFLLFYGSAPSSLFSRVRSTERPRSVFHASCSLRVFSTPLPCNSRHINYSGNPAYIPHGCGQS